MMVIKHVHPAGPNVRDVVGARQDVLYWGWGVLTGHVAAVQLKDCGGADYVVEFAAPGPPPTVPDDICARMGACRFDERCPYAHHCALHECSDECGWCQGGA